MKKRIFLFLVVSLVTAGVGSQGPAADGRGEKTWAGGSLEVYNPTGSVRVTNLHARRLQTLDHMTICELSDHMWESHRTFPAIREVLSRQFPETTIVPYTDLPNAYGVGSEALSNKIREKGCNGVIVGNAA